MLARLRNGAERTVGALAVAILLVAMLLAANRLTQEHQAAPTIDGQDGLDVEPLPIEPVPSETASDAPDSVTEEPTPSEEATAPDDGITLTDASPDDDSPPPPASAGVTAQSGTRATAASSSWFASRYPAHDNAIEDISRPDTTRWAVLIGVNEHTGSTRDNFGSAQDAEDLADHLLSLGWRDDHVLLLTDSTATQRHIVEGLEWLQRKTSGDSVVVIHYSGHVKQWYGWDVDEDGETTDEALWPSDNQFITDKQFSIMVAGIRADRMWVDIGGCEAAGFADEPILRQSMVMTFSSEEDEKSYEDPRRENSVWGWYMIDQGMLDGLGDSNDNGEVTVEESFSYARPQARTRTLDQSAGPQTPVMIDRLAGDFSLKIPPPPAPTPEPTESPTPDDDGGIILFPPPDSEDCFLVFCS